MDCMHVVGTMRHHPLGGSIDVSEVPTGRLISSIGHRLKSSLVRMPFPPPAPCAALCSPSLGQIEGETEASTQCCKEVSACWAVVVPRMLFNCWYISPTPSVEGAGNVSKSAATVATFWLALVKVGSCRSACTITAVQPASSIDSCWCRSASLASMAVHSSLNLPHCCAASHLAPSCRMRRRSSW
jgi:hypothetical protein